MKKKLVLPILFCLLLAAGTLLGLILPDRRWSDHERRSLKQAPALTGKSFFSGKYGQELETYLADQFPGRDGWVSAKTAAERLSCKPESGGVSFAADGWLIERHPTLNEAQLSKNLAALKSLSDRLGENGIPLTLMPVPTASCILWEKLPALTPEADQGLVISAAEEAGLSVCSVASALEDHRWEYIYYRTDHHWTSLGAYYAYAAWREAAGKTPAPLETWTRETLTERFYGTTWAKVNDPFALPDTIEAWYQRESRPVSYNGGNSEADSIYERKFLNTADPYGVFFNSNQADAVARGAGEGRLLILKDSYANCFAQFCLDDYEETHLIDLRFFRGSVSAYAAQHGITEVLVLYNIPNFCEDTMLAHVR